MLCLEAVRGDEPSKTVEGYERDKQRIKRAE
jgi:hypothetical protein